MNKVKFKKMLHAYKQGRDLKQLFDKESAKEFAKELVKSHALKVLLPVLAKILIVVLIIAILLGVFLFVYQGISGRWEQIANAWGHLWQGTASQVSDDDVSNLYYNLLNQGVDFEEIGAVGEHSFLDVDKSFIDNPALRDEVERKIDNVREKYTVQYYLDTITDSDLKPVMVQKGINDYINGKTDELVASTEMTPKRDKNGNLVMETKGEAAARLLSQRLLGVRESEVIKDGEYAGYNKLNINSGIGLYLKRYMLAEKETFTVRDSYTIADEGYKGSIFIDNGKEEEKLSNILLKGALMTVSPITTPIVLYDMFKDVTGSFSMVENENINGKDELVVKVDTKHSVIYPENVDGDRVKTEDIEETFVITNYVNDYAMPWQYPFAFHQHTLSPDIGYEVALMAHKYHNLYLQVRPTESGCLKIFSEDGNIIGDTYSLVTPELYVRKMSTWYETVDYDYTQDPHTAWHGEAKDIALNYQDVQAANINTPDSDTVRKSAIMIETITTINTHTCSSHGSYSEEKEKNTYACSLDAPTDTITKETSSVDHHVHRWHTTSADGTRTEHSRSCSCTCTTIVIKEYEKQILVECDYIYEDNPVVTISDTMPIDSTIAQKTGIEAMTELLLPEPEMDINTMTITNENQVPKYYTANNLQKREDGTSKDKLVISTSAEAIIKSLCDLYSGNDYSYENVDIENMEAYDSSLEDYMTVGLEYNMVRQLIQFFATNGVVDGSAIYGVDETNSFAIMADWFISGNSVSITSRGSIATIITGNNRQVTSPVTGRIIKDDETGYIYIQTDKLGTIYLNNIQLDSSIKLGQNVSKGQLIGTTIGNVSYYRTDSTGQEIQEPANELKQLQTIKFSDYAWPVPDSGNVTSTFGKRVDPITGQSSSHHNGVDIGASEGTPIVSYMAGEIIKAGYDPNGYGYYIIVKHTDSCYTLYAHMSRFAKRSGLVQKGEVIGYVGSTGRSTGPHLHFEYRQGPRYADAINPLTKLKNYSYY